MSFQPVIKWSGSKRNQSEKIISYFPKAIDTYYEPFIGGGSILYQLLSSDNVVNKYVVSDICQPLIDLWNKIKTNPQDLVDEYTKRWNELQKDDNFYYSVRTDFNKNKLPNDFLFLSRTCVNGLIRFNKKGEFNSPFHLNRKGIEPKKLAKVVSDWSAKIQKVEFVCMDFIDIVPKEDDFVYCDPPYFHTKGMYYGDIKFDDFTTWLAGLKCPYAFSYDGKQGAVDKTVNVPKGIFDEHVYINSGNSSFSRLFNDKKDQYVQESLYIKK